MALLVDQVGRSVAHAHHMTSNKIKRVLHVVVVAVVAVVVVVMVVVGHLTNKRNNTYKV